MAWIGALQYALTALAAVFGIASVRRLRAQLKAPSEAGARLLDRFMVFSVLLLLLSGVLAIYDGYVLQESRQARAIAPVLARMDVAVGEKLDVANDAFAPMDSLSRQALDNILRQLCRDVIELANAVAASAPQCAGRLQRAPFEAPT